MSNSSENKADRDLSDYEKFRMGRIADNSDSENMSAHFGNQLSTRTER